MDGMALWYGLEGKHKSMDFPSSASLFIVSKDPKSQFTKFVSRSVIMKRKLSLSGPQRVTRTEWVYSSPAYREFSEKHFGSSK